MTDHLSIWIIVDTSPICLWMSFSDLCPFVKKILKLLHLRQPIIPYLETEKKHPWLGGDNSHLSPSSHSSAHWKSPVDGNQQETSRICKNQIRCHNLQTLYPLTAHRNSVHKGYKQNQQQRVVYSLVMSLIYCWQWESNSRSGWSGTERSVTKGPLPYTPRE